jgi:hypothetical protein
VNHRITAGALASCALVLTAALTGCGAHPSPAGRPEAGSAPPSSPSPSPPGTAGASPEAAAGSASAGARGPGAAGPTGHADGSGSPGTGSPRPRTARSGLPPKPGADDEAAYVRALTAIDPDIVHDDEDRAVARGREQCRTIHGLPGDRDGQIAAAGQRFTSPGHPHGFGTAKGARIVDAVHTNLCPGF